jgi:hypothetical protein
MNVFGGLCSRCLCPLGAVVVYMPRMHVIPPTFEGSHDASSAVLQDALALPR